jgi:hypothetical protein
MITKKLHKIIIAIQILPVLKKRVIAQIKDMTIIAKLTKIILQG